MIICSIDTVSGVNSTAGSEICQVNRERFFLLAYKQGTCPSFFKVGPNFEIMILVSA